MPNDDELDNEELKKNESENQPLGMRERDIELNISEDDVPEENLSNSLDDSFDEDYQSEEDFAKDDGVFDKKTKTIDERAKKSYERTDNNFLNADVIRKEEYAEYVKNGKQKGKTVVVQDARFAKGENIGFTEGEQLKFGWRSLRSNVGVVVKDKILPQFDPEHKTLSVLKMIALPVTLPARGIWAGLKAIGRGFSSAGRWIGEKLGIVKPDNNPLKIDLIGDNVEYENSDRASGNVTTDIKRNKVTPDMIYNSVISKTTFEHVGIGKEVTKNLINGTTKTNYVNALKTSRDNLLAHVFGKGNPLGAYNCVLDQKALKSGIYKFDDKVTDKFLRELSDEKLDRYADKTISRVKKEYFKERGGEEKAREELEKSAVKDNVAVKTENAPVNRVRIEVPEAADKELVQEKVNEDVKENVVEINPPEQQSEKSV